MSSANIAAEIQFKLLNERVLSIGELLYTLFITFNVAIATFKNLLNMAILEERLNKTDIEKVG